MCMFVRMYRERSEKAMAPHSSTFAWKIPWMEEPGRLQSMGSLTVGHNWATSLSLFTLMHWRRKWQPTPVLLPGESQGRGSLVGCRLWGHTELDTTEVTQQQQHRDDRERYRKIHTHIDVTHTSMLAETSGLWVRDQSFIYSSSTGEE